MSANPAALLGVAGGVIEAGKPADITLIDPDEVYTYTKESMISKGKNSPFIGMNMQGRAALTMVGGNVVYDGRKR